MKKHLFLSILVFCITVGCLGNNTISESLHVMDQEEVSKTKESSEIYASNTLVDTKEIKIEETSQDKIQTMEKNIEINEQQKPTIQNNEKKIKEEKKSIYEFLKFSNDIPSENIKTVENELSKLPKNIVESFDKKKWSIELTDENISTKFFKGAYKTVIGVTVTASREIYIQNNKNSIKQALIHEFGHYIDWYYNYPSENQEFKQIYNNEVETFKSRITNSSCVSNEMEFFAHTFYYFIKDESKCTPKALEFIQKYINQM